MEQGSPLKAVGARRRSGFSLAKKCFSEPFGNWLLSKSAFTWLAGEYVEAALKLPALGDQSRLEL